MIRCRPEHSWRAGTDASSLSFVFLVKQEREEEMGRGSDGGEKLE